MKFLSLSITGQIDWHIGNSWPRVEASGSRRLTPGRSFRLAACWSHRLIFVTTTPNGTLWCTKSGSSANVSRITLRPATGSGSISTTIVASSTEQQPTNRETRWRRNPSATATKTLEDQKHNIIMVECTRTALRGGLSTLAGTPRPTTRLCWTQKNLGSTQRRALQRWICSMSPTRHDSVSSIR
jgi:hypothetical protein